MTRKEKWRRRFKFINWYPPYWAAGIRVKEVNEDITRIVVEMRMGWYNRNMFGTHFGGSLYSMCDPHYVFIVMMNLGGDYIVWDRAANIRFRRATKKKVRAVFELSQEEIQRIKEEVDEAGKQTFWRSVQVKDMAGNVVAEIDKEIYVKRKDKTA